MSLAAYKVFHLLGIFFLFTALGGSVAAQMAARAGGGGADKIRKLAGMTHGIALLLILIAGFGALASLGAMQTGMPGWVWLKLGVWVILGASPFILRKAPQLAGLFWWLLPFFGAAAAYLALYKPV